MKFRVLIPLIVLLAACGGNSAGTIATRPGAESLSAGQLDSLWQQASAAFREGDWTDALALFERYTLEAGSGDVRLVEARMFMAESHFADGARLEAAREFRRVSDETPTHPLAPDALLRVGDAYAELWRRPELDPSYGQSALATYQELLSRYPDSDAADRAQLRILELNNDFAFKALKAAKYYLRLNADDSAIIYLKDLVATYPRADVAPEALILLIGAYRELEYVEDVRETCDYLARFHPDAPGTDEACPGQAASITVPAP